MRHHLVQVAVCTAVATALCCAPAGIGTAVASGDVVSTVDFEAYAPGTVITNQYPAITFESPTAADFTYGAPADGVVSNYVTVPEPQVTTTGPHSGAHAGELVIPGEFAGAGAFGALSNLADSVSVYIGDMVGSGTDVELDAYGADRALLGSDTAVTSAAGAQTLLSFSTGGKGEIAYIAIYRAEIEGQGAVIDDLTISVPPGSYPIVGVATSTTTYELGQGGTRDLPLSVTRINSANAPVTITLGSLPSGVTGTLAQDPVALPATGTTLTLSATATAPTGNYTVTLSATASGANSQAPTVITLAIVPALSVVVPTNAQVGACGSHPFSIVAQVAPGLSGPVSFGASTVSPGLSVAVSPAQVALSNGSAGATLSVSSSGGGVTGSVQVTASLPDGATQKVAVPVQQLGPQVTAVSAISQSVNGAAAGGLKVLTPRADQPGTTVEIYGHYFCNQATVGFGNSEATVTATVSHESGNQGPFDYLRVATPVDATDGPVTVTSGSPAASAQSSGSLTVDSYRNNEAFNFANFLPNLQFSDLTDAFGSQQTYINFNPCGIFTLGLANCSVALVPDPVAVAEFLIAEASMSGGTCFGISLTDQRLLSGEVSASSFARNGSLIYGITGPQVDGSDKAVGSEPVLLTLKADHLMQISTEFMKDWGAKATAQSLSSGDQVATAIAKEIAAIFAAGRFPLIELNDGNGGGGHVVVAYNMTHDGAGGWDIYVYDSNLPFSSQEDTDGALHAQNVTASMLHLAANGTWDLPSTTEPDHHTPFQGGPSAIVVTDPTAVPLHPTLATLGGAAPGLLFSSAGAPGTQGGASAAAARVAQVTGADGKTLYRSNGKLNTDPATRLPAAPFEPLVSGGRAAAPALTVLAGNVGPVKVVTSGKANGATDETLVGNGFVGSVTFSAAKGTDETESFAPGSDAVGLSGPGAHDLSLSVQRASASGVLSVQADSGTSAGSSTLSVDPASGAVTLAHKGPAATFTLDFSGESGHGLPGSFKTSPILVGSGQNARVSGIRWSDLGGSSARLSLGGRTLKLANKAPVIKLVKIAGLKAGKTVRGKVLFTLTGKFAGPLANGRAAVIWAVRGKHVVARHVTVLSTNVRSFRSTWSVKLAARSGLTLTTDVVAVAATGTSEVSSVASRSLALAAH